MKRVIGPTALAAVLCACTVVQLDPRESPQGVRASGLIDGHLVFGWSAEDAPLRLQLFDGRGDGALVELAVWKLFRIEVGLAGASIGVGPIDMGLGVLLYEPALPPQPERLVPEKKVEAPAETGQAADGAVEAPRQE